MREILRQPGRENPPRGRDGQSLNSEERFRRSRKLAELALDATVQCVGPTSSGESQQVLDQARKTLNGHVRISRQDEAFEANLDLAEQLWQIRKAACKSPAGAHDPLALVLARLAQ